MTTFKTFKDEVFDNVTIREKLVCGDITAIGNFLFNNFPLFASNNDARVFLATQLAQVIPDVTRTQLTGWVIGNAAFGGFNTATSAWTCPASGIYTLQLQVVYNAGAGTYRNAEIFQAGFIPVVVSSNFVNDSTGSSQARAIISTQVAQGSVWTFFTKQDSGGNLSTIALSTRLEIIRWA